MKNNPKGDVLNNQALSQLEKWQLILQAQCDALITLGFDPAIKVRTTCQTLCEMVTFFNIVL